MFRDLSATNTLPVNISQRRRHQPRPDLSLNSHVDRPFSAAGGADGSLDMSMHRPRAPYNNRFASLATPPPRDHVSGRHRRPRNSRGTRDAKRRRDARRNRRNGAVQALDEQLSRNIDQTLTLANTHPAPAVTTAPDAWKADLTFNWPSWTRLPPTPPQLPVLDLGDLDLHRYALPAAAEQKLPPTPPPVAPCVPIWCPYIPSLMRDGGWHGEVPKFTDLSSVSERRETRKMDSLIPWLVFKAAWPRKQSRFFPSLTTSVSTPAPPIKSPPTGCKLYRSEQVSHDPISTTWSETFAREVVPCIKPRSSAHIAGKDTSHEFTHIQARTQEGQSPGPDSTNLASAANLWRILSADGWPTPARTRTNQCHANHNVSDADDSEDTGGVPVNVASDQPLEPESASIPYVHLNSLVGHANGTGEHATALDDNPLFSALYLADFFATPRAGTPVFELSATPRLHTTSSSMLRTVVPGQDLAGEIDVLATQKHDDTVRPDEHFSSEQGLFMPENIMLPQSRAESAADLTALSPESHEENCGEPPVLIGGNELLEAEDDDWLDWSTLGDDEASINSPPLPATVVDIPDEDEGDFRRHFCTNASEPSHEIEFGDEFTEDFLDYCDEVAFAHGLTSGPV